MSKVQEFGLLGLNSYGSRVRGFRVYGLEYFEASGLGIWSLWGEVPQACSRGFGFRVYSGRYVSFAHVIF